MTNSNYIIRKTGTNYTQFVHRIRLTPIILTEPPKDIHEIDPTKFEVDPSRRTTRNEPELFDEYIPNLLEEEQSTTFSKTVSVQPSQIPLGVTVSLNGAPAMPLVAPVPPIVPIIPPIPVIPPAEIRTLSPMNSPRNSQENSPRASFSDSPSVLQYWKNFSILTARLEPLRARELEQMTKKVQNNNRDQVLEAIKELTLQKCEESENLNHGNL